MELKRVGTQPSIKGPAEWFTGSVRIRCRVDPCHQRGAFLIVQESPQRLERVRDEEKLGAVGPPGHRKARRG